jgi:dihydrodipicolinate synthase/N-acetylneuraminate lyase
MSDVADRKGARTLRGVLPVFQTPFHDDGTIDAATLEREIDWLLGLGCDGIVMGMVSETLRLASDEREQLAQLACRFGRDRGVVVISAGAESTHTAVRYARQAEHAGADAVMVIPPLAVALGEDELRRYYDQIVMSIDIPVVVQDASGYVGRPMSIAFQAALHQAYGARVLFKPEAQPLGPRLSALRDATAGRAAILEGSGGIALVDSFRRGVVGTMPGADLADGMVALWRALQAGDEAAAYRLSLPIAALIAMQSSLDAFLAIEKYLLHKRGIFRNRVVRGPSGYTLDDETRAEVDRLFARLQAALA